MSDTQELLTTEAIAEIRRSMLAWYDEEHRPLPWRVNPSPYATVVSEFMLQQTQVAAVIPFFERFMERFPSFRRLAEAAEQDVLREWSGLGYYARARMLKRAAEIIVREHNSRLPRSAQELAALPGFGPYMVGAVGSIALGLPLPLVDGNVRRVVGRLLALEGDLTTGRGKRALWAAAAALVDPDRPGDFNQALMDLGATVCVPREPLCLICPLFGHCRARVQGIPEDYPAPVRRPATQALREVAVALMRGTKLLVLQRGEGRAFAGLWELPRLDARDMFNGELTPERVLFDLVRIRPTRLEPAGRAESAFTRYRVQTELYRAEDNGRDAVRRQQHVAHRWVTLKELARLPASKAQRRLFELLAPQPKDKRKKSDRSESQEE